MTIETYALTVSIPLKNGARAEATFYVNDGDTMTLPQAMEVKKLLRSADGELYANIRKTTVDDDFRPT